MTSFYCTGGVIMTCRHIISPCHFVPRVSLDLPVLRFSRLWILKLHTDRHRQTEKLTFLFIMIQLV